MSALHVFVSFDVDHDADLYEQLIAHSRLPDVAFSVAGCSERSNGTDVWSERVRRQIREADHVIVICGQHTEASMSVSAELRMAQQERTSYFLLWGRREIMCTKPIGARSADGMYSWTRQILRDQLILALRRARADATAEAPRGKTRNG